MKKLPTLSLLAVLAAVASTAQAGIPAPGPEIGEGSIGLLALGVSAAAYAVYKFKNKK